MSKTVPDKGDIVVISFNPQAGHEQAGDTRPALVISPASFNKTTGFAMVCPVTKQKKGYPFEVGIEGTERTTGVVLSDQCKSLDWKSRNAIVVDSVNDETLKAVRVLVATIVNA